MEFALLSTQHTIRSVQEVCFLLDSVDAAAAEWGHVLADAHPPALETLNAGQTLALMSRLEVHPENAWRGLGTWAAQRMLALLGRRHKVCLTYLRPYPLQFEMCSQQLSRRQYDSRWADFERARQALQSLYTAKLGAQTLAADPQWMVALAADQASLR